LTNQAVETTVYSLDETPPKRQRRRSQRHLTLYRVGALTIGERRELCLIKNVSAGGMLIRVYSDIAPGTRLSVELKQGEPVLGMARWAEKDSVGVVFDAPIDVLSLIALREDGPRPRMPRIEVGCEATIRDGARVFRVTAVNVSQGGLQVHSAADLAIDADIIVRLTGLPPEPATVKWRDGDCYGLAFNRVLAITQLVGWLQAQQA
jgi:hypothetical protein